MRRTHLPTGLYNCECFVIQFLGDVAWERFENEYDFETSTQKAALLLRECPHLTQLLNDFVSATGGQTVPSTDPSPLAIAKASHEWAVAYDTKYGSTHSKSRKGPPAFKEGAPSQLLPPPPRRPQLRRRAVSAPAIFRPLVPRRHLATAPFSQLEIMADKLSRESIELPDFSAGSGGFEFFLESIRSIPGPAMAPTLTLEEMAARKAAIEDEEALMEASMTEEFSAVETPVEETPDHELAAGETMLETFVQDLREAGAEIEKESAAEEASREQQQQSPKPTFATPDTPSSDIIMGPSPSIKEPKTDEQPASDDDHSSASIDKETIQQQQEEQRAPVTEPKTTKINLMDRKRLSTPKGRRELVAQTFPELYSDDKLRSTVLRSNLFREEFHAERGRLIRASQNIIAGTCLVTEKPLLVFRNDDEHIGQIYDQFVTMQPARQREILELDFSCSIIRRAIIVMMTHVPIEKRTAAGDRLPIVLAIALKNHTTIKPRLNISTLYTDSSRLQYSCVPNTERSYDPKTKTNIVNAIRDIKPGEIITFNRACNIADSFAIVPRAERFVHFDALALVCSCDACSKTDEEAAEAEKLRVRAAELVTEQPDPFLMGIKQLEPLLEVCEKIGIRGTFMSYVFMRASHLHYNAGHPSLAFDEAEKAARLARDAVGEDNDHFRRADEQVKNIRRNLTNTRLNAYWRVKYGHNYY